MIRPWRLFASAIVAVLALSATYIRAQNQCNFEIFQPPPWYDNLTYPPLWTHEDNGTADLSKPVCDSAYGRGQCVYAHGTEIISIRSDDGGGGQELWHSQQGLCDSCDILGLPTLALTKAGTEMAFVGAQDGFLYAFDATTATGTNVPVWSRDVRRTVGATVTCPFEDGIIASPAVQLWNRSNDDFKNAQPDDLIFVITRYGCDNSESTNRVYAFREATHSVAWVFNLDGSYPMDYGSASCTVDYTTNTLYCGTQLPAFRYQNTVWAIDTLTGALKWGGNYGGVVTQPIIGYGGQRLYVNSYYPLVVHALDKNTGEEIWSYKPYDPGAHFASNMSEYSRPDAQPILWVTDDAGYLYGLIDSGASARQYARTNFGSKVTTAPVVSRGNGKVFVGLSNGAVHEFDPIIGDNDFYSQIGTGRVYEFTLDGPSRLVVGAVDGLNQTTKRVGVPWYPQPINFVADISLSLSAPTQVTVGEDFVYTLLVTNNGPNWATDVNVTDSLPTSLTNVRATTTQGDIQFSYALDSSARLVASLGDIAPGGSATINLTVNTAFLSSTAVTNIASVIAGEYDPDVRSNIACTTTTVVTPDTVPPTLSVPANFTAEADSPAGKSVNYSVSATDDRDPNPTVVCTPASGSTFPLGPTLVACTATDASGNSVSASFTITVIDTTPPALIVPTSITADATSPAGVTVTYSVSALDIVDPHPKVACNLPSGSVFHIGSNNVTCTATDFSTNTASKTFSVAVKGAADQISDTITLINSFNLSQTTKTSLTNALQEALAAINSGNLASACDSMNTFIRQVRSQAGKKLTAAQANQLLVKANKIGAVLGCQ